MHLYFFQANNAWAFVFGEDIRTAQPTTLAGHDRFFNTRAEAVQAAKGLGLAVDRKGRVSIASLSEVRHA